MIKVVIDQDKLFKSLFSTMTEKKNFSKKKQLKSSEISIRLRVCKL